MTNMFTFANPAYRPGGSVYEKFVIKQCAEYEYHQDGGEVTTGVEAYDPADDQDGRHRKTWWGLYGIWRDGTSQHIGDFNTFAAAKEILDNIGVLNGDDSIQQLNRINAEQHCTIKSQDRHIENLHEQIRQLEAQVKNLMDPIERAKMLQPGAPIVIQQLDKDELVKTLRRELDVMCTRVLELRKQNRAVGGDMLEQARREMTEVGRAAHRLICSAMGRCSNVIGLPSENFMISQAEVLNMLRVVEENMKRAGLFQYGPPIDRIPKE